MFTVNASGVEPKTRVEWKKQKGCFQTLADAQREVDQLLDNNTIGIEYLSIFNTETRKSEGLFSAKLDKRAHPNHPNNQLATSLSRGYL